MKKEWNRFLALVMAVAMVISILPTHVHAQTESSCTDGHTEVNGFCTACGLPEYIYLNYSGVEVRFEDESGTYIPNGSSNYHELEEIRHDVFPIYYYRVAVPATAHKVSINEEFWYAADEQVLRELGQNTFCSFSEEGFEWTDRCIHTEYTEFTDEHTYDPTCTQQGAAGYQCDNCQEKAYDWIPVLKHNWQESDTCLNCGIPQVIYVDFNGYGWSSVSVDGEPADMEWVYNDVYSITLSDTASTLQLSYAYDEFFGITTSASILENAVKDGKVNDRCVVAGVTGEMGETWLLEWKPYCKHVNTETTETYNCLWPGRKTVVCTDCEETINVESLNPVGHVIEDGYCKYCQHSQKIYVDLSEIGGERIFVVFMENYDELVTTECEVDPDSGIAVIDNVPVKATRFKIYDENYDPDYGDWSDDGYNPYEYVLAEYNYAAAESGKNKNLLTVFIPEESEWCDYSWGNYCDHDYGENDSSDYCLNCLAYKSDVYEITLDIANGGITITDTGYTQGGTTYAYRWDYVITGTTGESQKYDVLAISSIGWSQQITLRNLSITAQGPYPISVGCDDVTLYVEGSLYLNSSNYALTASSSSYTVTMQASSADITLIGNVSGISTGNWDIRCNNLTIESKYAPAVYEGSLSVEAGGDISITSAGGNAVNLGYGDLSLAADGNIELCGSGSYAAVTAGAAELLGASVTITNQYGAVFAGSSLDITSAVGDVTISAAGSTPAIQTTGNVSIEAAGDLEITSSNAGIIQAGGSIALATAAHVNLIAGGYSPALSGKNLNIAAPNGDISLHHQGAGMAVAVSGSDTEGNVAITSGGCVTITANATSPAMYNTGSFSIDAASDITIVSKGMIVSGGTDFTVNTLGDVYFEGDCESPIVYVGTYLMDDDGEEILEQNMQIQAVSATVKRVTASEKPVIGVDESNYTGILIKTINGDEEGWFPDVAVKLTIGEVETFEKSLEAALEAIGETDEPVAIQLMRNIEADDAIILDRDLTLNLNGYSIIQKEAAANEYLLQIVDAIVTIRGTDEDGNRGSISYPGAASGEGSLSGTAVEIEGCSYVSIYYTDIISNGTNGIISVIHSETEGWDLEICDTTVTCNDGAAVLLCEETKASLSGASELSGCNGVELDHTSQLLIGDNSVIKGASYGVGIFAMEDAIISMISGTVSGGTGINLWYSADLYIDGGMVTGTNEHSEAIVVDEEEHEIFISGGLFSHPVKEEYCAEGYEPTSYYVDDELLYSVKPVEQNQNPLTSYGKSLLFEDIVRIKYYFAYDSSKVNENIDMAKDTGILVWTEYGAFEPETADYKVEGLTATEVDGQTLYYAIGEGIPAKQWGDDIYACGYIMIDGEYVLTEPTAYSPLTYASRMLSKEETQEDEELTNLLVAMLNYGTAAQDYFDYKTSIPVNSILTAAQKSWTWDDSMLTERESAPVIGSGDADLTFYGWSLMFEGAIGLRMYSEVNEDLLANATTCGLLYWSADDWNTTSNPLLSATMVEGLTKYADGLYYATIPGTAAKDLGETYYACVFVVVDEMLHLGELKAYSAHTYAKNMIGKESQPETLKDLVKTMVIYGNAANAYFN